jgi:hypothetical protein
MQQGMANLWKVMETSGATNLSGRERAALLRASEMILLTLRSVAKMK